MVYQLDTPGLEDQAVTNDKIESGTIEINRLDSTLAGALVPVGGIIMWSGTLDQINGFPNWQLCDGSAISSGALSGTTTPNLTGRFVIGTNTYDAGQNRWEETITGSNNQTGGSKDSHLPSHTHGINTSGNATLTDNGHNHGITDNGHSHSISFTNTDSGFGRSEESGNGGESGTNSTNSNTTGISVNSNTTGITLGGSTESQGTSNTNMNLPPYYALAYIIRIN